MPTPKLNLPLIIATSEIKEQEHNEAIIILEALAHLTVIDRDITDPSTIGAPVDGDTYIVATSAIGAWAGQDLNIAVYFSGWVFVTSFTGMQAFVVDEVINVYFSAGIWNTDPQLGSITIQEHGSVSFEGTSQLLKITGAGALITFNDPTDITVDLAGGFPTIINRTTTAPPGSPVVHDRYIVAATATGAWATHENEIATWDVDGASQWNFIIPPVGLIVNDLGANEYVEWGGATWAVGTGFPSGGGGLLGINDQSGTTYTLVAGDAFDLVRLNNAAAIALTVPTNASVPFAIGTEIYLRQVGAGAVTISGGGVTFTTPDDLVLGTAGETAKLVKVATDTWDVVKDLSGSAPATAVNTQTGATYTLALTDAQDIVEMNRGTANTLTIPTNAAVPFAIGTVISITMLGVGVTTVTGDTAVTVNGVSAGGATIDGQFQGVSIYKRATDEWVMQGAHGTVA